MRAPLTKLLTLLLSTAATVLAACPWSVTVLIAFVTVEVRL